MTIIRLLLVLGILGHAITLYCDRILSIFPHGRLMLKNIQKLRESNFAANLMEGVSPRVPLRSGVLGVFSIVLEFCGYSAMAAYVFQQTRVFGVILFYCTVYSCIVSSAYHLKCGLAQYVFLKYNRTEQAKTIILDLMDCGPALRSCFVTLLAYMVVLFAAIVTGAIGFPVWAVIFTILPLFAALYPFQIIGTLHIAAMLSMLAWILLI